MQYFRWTRWSMFLLLFLLAQSAWATCPGGPIVFTGGNWDFANHHGASVQDPVLCDIVIPAGPPVRLTGTTLFLDAGVSITVELGAMFIVDACTLSGRAATDMWDGIIALGDTSLAETDPMQSKIFLRDSRIEYAVIGVQLGANNPQLISMDGGTVLTALRNEFYDCGRYAIYFSAYPWQASASKIIDNQFEQDFGGMSPAGFVPGFIGMTEMFNTVIQGNTFVNSSAAPTVQTDMGTGMWLGSAAPIIKENEFERLETGIATELAPAYYLVQLDPFYNGLVIRENVFRNNVVAIKCTGTRDNNIYANTIIVDAGNRSVMPAALLSAGYERAFTGILLQQNGMVQTTMRHTHLLKNDFYLGESYSLPSDAPLHLTGIHEGGTLSQNDVRMISNEVHFGLPPSPSLHVAKGISLDHPDGADYKIECNDFHFSPNNTGQRAIFCSLTRRPVVIGRPHEGAGNMFSAMPCGQGIPYQVEAPPNSIYYFEVPALGLIHPGCMPNVNIQVINQPNGCPVPAPPTIIPGSIPPMLIPPAPKAPAIPSLSTMEDWQMAPNPSAAGTVTVRLPSGEGSLRLTDLAGRVVLDVAVSQSEEVLAVGHLPRGVYLVTYEHANHRSTQRLLLQ